MPTNDEITNASSRSYSENDFQDFVDLAVATAEALEVDQQFSIGMDKNILREVFERMNHNLSQIAGIRSPDEFKIAAEAAFWIRKLKPFRVPSFQSDEVDALANAIFQAGRKNGVDEELLQRILNAALKKCAPPKLKYDGQERPREQFVNETLAVRIAKEMLKADGIYLLMRPGTLHDFITNLRFNSMSPSAIRVVLEAADPPDDDIRPTLRYHDERSSPKRTRKKA